MASPVTVGGVLGSIGGSLARTRDSGFCSNPCSDAPPQWMVWTLTQPLVMHAERTKTFVHTWNEEMRISPEDEGLDFTGWETLTQELKSSGTLVIPAGTYYLMLVGWSTVSGRAIWEANNINSLKCCGDTEQREQRGYADSLNDPAVVREATATSLRRLRILGWLNVHGEGNWLDHARLLRIDVQTSGLMRSGVEAGGSINWTTASASAWDSSILFDGDGEDQLLFTTFLGTEQPSQTPGAGYIAHDREKMIVGYGEWYSGASGTTDESLPWPGGTTFIGPYTSVVNWSSNGDFRMVGTIGAGSVGTSVQTHTRALAEYFDDDSTLITVDVATRPTSGYLKHPVRLGGRYRWSFGSPDGTVSSGISWGDGLCDWVYEMEGCEEDMAGEPLIIGGDPDGYVGHLIGQSNGVSYQTTGRRYRSSSGVTINWGAGTCDIDYKLVEMCGSGIDNVHRIYRVSTEGIKGITRWVEIADPCIRAFTLHYDTKVDDGVWYPTYLLNSADICLAPELAKYPTGHIWNLRVCPPEDDDNNGGGDDGSGCDGGECEECSDSDAGLGLCGDLDPDAEPGDEGDSAGGDLNPDGPYADLCPPGFPTHCYDACQIYPEGHPLRPTWCGGVIVPA